MRWELKLFLYEDGSFQWINIVRLSSRISRNVDFDFATNFIHRSICYCYDQTLVWASWLAAYIYICYSTEAIGCVCMVVTSKSCYQKANMNICVYVFRISILSSFTSIHNHPTEEYNSNHCTTIRSFIQPSIQPNLYKQELLEMNRKQIWRNVCIQKHFENRRKYFCSRLFKTEMNLEHLDLNRILVPYEVAKLFLSSGIKRMIF